MTTSAVEFRSGSPVLRLNNDIIPAVAAYVGPRYTAPFRQARIQLFTFFVPGIWWIGPQQYDFREIDEYLDHYMAAIPGAYFMPRIDLSRQGFPWWGTLHPDEMNLLLDLRTGHPLDPLAPNPKAVPYLGHEVDLRGVNLHSFHSHVWRADAGAAIAALVAHCEAMPYAGKIWAWHVCDGLFCEWFHWNEYHFDGLADYSPAAQADFRNWLRHEYHNDPAALSAAWGRPVEFDTIQVPLPHERSRPARGEFYDPVADRPAIDYSRCFSEATADSIVAVCEAVKSALPQPKLTCVFYGYQFSNMPRPQCNAHYALERLLASPAVDMLASPHTYSNRGEGGYHSSQTPLDAVRRAGKLHFDEIDCKTVWTPATVTWKRHIRQPRTVESTIEMLKKDAAFAIATGSASWWMDLTDEGWFNAPEVVEPIRRLRQIEQHMLNIDRRPFAEVALVVSQRSMHFQAARAGLHNACLKIFRNWHLSRMGAPFEQLLISDLDRADLPQYRLYIFANLFAVTDAERQTIERVLRRNHATALWIYAPGYLDDRSASVDAMQRLTGIRAGIVDTSGTQDVTLTDFEHLITHGLNIQKYGTGIDIEQYQAPQQIQYLPDMRFGPSFYADDPDARVLGYGTITGRPGLVVKEMGDWCSIFSTAPLLPWPLMRNIARFAGAHVYNDQGDFVWANRGFLALYSQSAGQHHLRFPRATHLTDAYTGERLGEALTEITFPMRLWETNLYYREEHHPLPFSKEIQ